MKRTHRALLLISLLVLLLGGLALFADMPPRTTYWAEVDAIEAAAKGFPATEAAAFKAELEKASVPGSKAGPGLDPSFKTMSENGLFGALVHLITPHVAKSEIKRVTDFLKIVSDGKLIRGNLLARNGGDFTTQLQLVTGKDGKYVLRQYNGAVKPGAWQGSTFDRPLGIGPPSTRPR